MAGKDTTRKGVPGNDRETGHVDESPDRPLTPREEALAAIKQTRLERFNDELEEGGGQRVVFASDPNADPAPDPDEAADPPPPAPVPGVPPSAPKPADPPPPAPGPAPTETALEQMQRQLGIDDKGMVKVKVEGEEIEVPFATVVANYQKTSTADKRLREATADADRIRREAAATPPAPPAPGPAPAPAGKAFTTALFEGDEDAANAALQAEIQRSIDAAIEARGPAATKPTDEALAEIEARAVERVTQQFEAKSVLRQSKLDYPDLYSDPDVEALASAKIKRRMDEGVLFADALHAVEGELASKFGWKKGGRPPAPAPGNRDLTNDRLDRKAGLDALPTASARRGAPDEAEPVMDESARAARGIEQLRAGRPGQQQA